MNNLQTIAENVSGYNPLTQQSGASDDGYKGTINEKVAYLSQPFPIWNEKTLDFDSYITLTEIEASFVVYYLEGDYSSQDQQERAFTALGNW